MDDVNEKTDDKEIGEGSILSDEFLLEDDLPIIEDEVVVGDEDDEDDYMHTFDDRDDNY